MNGARILVVGAGPVGLALACHLRRLGLSVRVVEKRPGPSTTSKAIGLQYRVSEVLARLGVADRFLARGLTPTVVNLYEGRRRILRLRFRAPEGVSGRGAFAPRAILIPQSDTEALLAGLLAELGCPVEWNTEFLAYREEGEAVVSRLRRADGGEEEVVSDWLVGCDGARSAVRRQAGIAFAGKTYPLLFFMADLRLDWEVEHGENHVWLHRDGSFAALPLPAPGTWRLFVEVPDEAGRLPDGLTLDEIRRLMGERTGTEATVLGDPLWLSEFRIHCRMVDRMRSGRVFLAGDAAHIHSPTGGQGIATGIQDAANLAWKLARVARGAPDALLDSYGEERLPHAAEVLEETDRTTKLLFAPGPGWRLLRDLLVLPILRSEAVQKRMFGKFSQLHVHYRGSSLSREEVRGWRRPRIRAGDRAPDVAFLRAETGETTTLFELLRPLEPVVLLGDSVRSARLAEALGALEIAAFVVAEGGKGVAPDPEEGATPPAAKGAAARAGEVAPVPAGERLLDLHGDFRRLYRLKGEFLCLVRPDGHVGLLQWPTDEGGLKEYLRGICRPSDVERALPG